MNLRQTILNHRSKWWKSVRSLFGALVAGISVAQATPAVNTRPDALLAVDMNRSAIVDKIVRAWAHDLDPSQRDAFKAQIGALRADQLFSASTSANFEGVLEVLHAASLPRANVSPALGSAQTYYAAQSALNNAAVGTIPAAQKEVFSGVISEKSKALGDPSADLVYTPITPCRLFDTRAGLASALGTVGGTFSNQQTKNIVPNGACGIPSAGVASLFISFHAYNNNPAALGVIGFMKPAGAFGAMAATWTGAVWTTGTFIAGTNSNGSFDAFVGNGQPMTADMIVDVMGYFRAPQGAIGDITDIQTGAGSGLTGGVTSGAVSLSLETSFKLPQSCANGQVPKSNGAGAWTCAADVTVTNAWTQGGNAFGAAGVIGTTDAQSLTVQSGGGQISVLVSGGSGLRVLANSSGANIVNGDASNTIGNSGGGLRGVTVSGGTVNRGGAPNGNNGWYSTIGGGQGNKTGADDNSTGDYATVAGGGNNSAGGNSATVAGGGTNTASGAAGTVGGGSQNTASGVNATVPGGLTNVASGAYSFAAGRVARADQASCAVFNLWSAVIQTGCAGLPSIFRVAANNGLTVDFGAPDVAGNGSDWVFIGPIFAGKHIAAKSGAFLSSGGVWTNSSDQTKKEAFRSVDVQAVLRKVIALPVTTWSYIAEGKGTRRMGPMAQDFRKAFGLGMDDKSIGVVDADGVALAAIQGLNQKLDVETARGKAKDAKIDALEKKVEELSRLREQLSAIQKKLGL